jgi:hypothetical protein
LTGWKQNGSTGQNKSKKPTGAVQNINCLAQSELNKKSLKSRNARTCQHENQASQKHMQVCPAQKKKKEKSLLHPKPSE